MKTCLLENEALTALGKLPTDKIPTSSSKTMKPLFRSSIEYILSASNETLLTVVLDQPIGGILVY